MRAFLFILFSILTLAASAQEERDTVLKRCPVYIIDTTSNNNFFIDARPATLKVYRVKGDLTVVVEQRDQFFTLFFRTRKLKNNTYKITAFPRSANEMSVKYSFREDDQVSYISVGSGTVEAKFDEERKGWQVKVNGYISNHYGRSVTIYKVTTELFLL